MILRAIALLVAVSATVALARGQTRAAGTVDVQLLAINDFHGNLEPPSGANGLIKTTPAGGAEYLATHLKRAAAQNPHSLVVASGDLIGGSPLVSALFHDEPTIESLNAMGVAVSSVGNHEFDEGWRELLRIQNGTCHPDDGCLDAEGFGGAQFRYLAANVINRTTKAPYSTLFPATTIQTVGGVRIGFIGEILARTRRLVTPAAVRGLVFTDEVSRANTAAARLRRHGVNAIVLLIHEGGRQGPDDPAADINGCAGFNGPIVPIVENLSRDIRIVISGHTHRFYNCSIDGRLVTSASSFGRMFTRVALTIDRASGTITNASAANEVVTRDVAKDPEQTRIISKYAAIAAPLANRVVGSVTGDIDRIPNDAGESALGDVVADAQLAATRTPAKGGAQVAFMNPGGIRGDIASKAEPGPAGPGEVTYGQLFATQPFNDTLTVFTLTGAVIRRLLEQQFDNPVPGSRMILQVSAGFSYRYAVNAPAGRHVDTSSITLNGRRVVPTDRVRVSANSFLVTGGNNFTAFLEGTNYTGSEVDIDALVEYFRTRSPVAPGPQNRIVRTD